MLATMLAKSRALMCCGVRMKSDGSVIDDFSEQKQTSSRLVFREVRAALMVANTLKLLVMVMSSGLS